jgi:IS30 family transposase
MAQQHCEGKSLGSIAEALGRNKSSISRALARTASIEYQRYTPCRAHAPEALRHQEIRRADYPVLFARFASFVVKGNAGHAKP